MKIRYVGAYINKYFHLSVICCYNVYYLVKFENPKKNNRIFTLHVTINMFN